MHEGVPGIAVPAPFTATTAARVDLLQPLSWPTNRPVARRFKTSSPLPFSLRTSTPAKSPPAPRPLPFPAPDPAPLPCDLPLLPLLPRLARLPAFISSHVRHSAHLSAYYVRYVCGGGSVSEVRVASGAETRAMWCGEYSTCRQLSGASRTVCGYPPPASRTAAEAAAIVLLYCVA